MSIGDIRFTVLQTVNEVQRKLGLDVTSSLAANKISVELVAHINDVVANISDFGDWQECLATAMVTAQTSVRDYFVQTSAVIKNIGDIYISTRRGPLNSVDIQTMRILTRSTSYGQPSQFCVFGTDVNGNPLIRVRPTPDTSQDGSMFSILYYTKPPIYTTADGAVVIPFPARIVVMGTLAAYTLRESGGAPTNMYTQYNNDFVEGRRSALNRFNGNTGWDVSFSPGYRSSRRWR